MPLDITTLTLVDKPITIQEGLKILERDGYRCRYCGFDGNASFENALVMSVDFVLPRARKGKIDPNNLVACCHPCNTIKGKRVYRSFDDARTHVLARREQRAKSGSPSTARQSRRQHKYSEPNFVENEAGPANLQNLVSDCVTYREFAYGFEDLARQDSGLTVDPLA